MATPGAIEQKTATSSGAAQVSPMSPERPSSRHGSPGATAGEQPATTSASSRRRGRSPWWRIRLFRGMINDVRQRLPYYASDWTDAWDYRVVPATIYMYFAKCVVCLSCALALPYKQALTASAAATASSRPWPSRSTCSPRPTCSLASTRSSCPPSSAPWPLPCCPASPWSLSASPGPSPCSTSKVLPVAAPFTYALSLYYYAVVSTNTSP